MIISENMPNLADKSKEEEIQKRREQVNELLVKCWTEQRIADELGVSKITIVRDVKWLKEQSSVWADELVGEGFFYHMKKIFDEFEYLRRTLHESLDEDHTVKEKVMIIKTLVDLVCNHTQILSAGPTIQKMKQFVNRYKQSNLQNSQNYNNTI